MADEKTFHMTPDEFRKHGHAVVDWIADYYCAHRIVSCAVACGTGSDSGFTAREPSGERRVFRRDPGRRREADSSRHYALAVAEFLRLLSRQRIGACDSW